MKTSKLVSGLMMCLLLVAGTSDLLAQEYMFNYDPEKPLLLNTSIQIEANEAVNNIYNFNFKAAQKKFKWLKQQYSWHPLPYFLLGLSYWWRIEPNTNIETYDEPFVAYMDSAIYFAEQIYEENEEDPESAFFLSAAYGFKGKLYAYRENWTKATFAGKNALDYLEICKGRDDFSPELQFGDALYNYYAEWIPEHYGILKPILMFFPDGDKQLGIEQMREVSNNAFYTRTEAKYFLMRMLYDERKYMKAREVASSLHQAFPNNPNFQRYYARLLYSTGNFNKAETVSLDIIQKIDSNRIGYEGTSGRYAAFFLGQIYERRRNEHKAEHYYKRAVEFGYEVNATDKGYFLYSLLNLAQIAEKNGRDERAKDYYKQVKKFARRKQDVHREARRGLRQLRRS